MAKNDISGSLKRIKGRSGSEYFKAAVFVLDFLLLNLLFLGFNLTMKDAVPLYFDKFTKFTVLVMNFSMLVSEYFFHSIVQIRLIKFGDIISNTLKLVLTQVALMFLWLRLISDGAGFFRFMVIFAVTLYTVIIFSRVMEFWALNVLRRKGRNSQTVLFVGNDPSLLRLYNSLTTSASVGYRVLGYYADSTFKKGPDSLRYLGTLQELNAQFDEWDANPLQEIPLHEIFCSLPHDESDQVKRIMRSCDKSVIRFYYVPRIFEDYEINLKMQSFGEYTVFTNHLEPLRKPVNCIVKRAFDLTTALIVCLFLVPITAIVGLIIKLQSPGPIFFKQGRTGLDGSTFNCYKFRSMHVNKDCDNLQATKNDPRKFPFGDFMRKANIDELPQFYNVLLGDMSIVGPRPHMLHHTEIYGKLIDKYMVRHFCKPGITGWAQVTGFRGETQELWQMEERVKRDIWYIENWSFLLDLKIIWLTTKSVFIHDKNAY
ncbi:MAG: undecaprenyl-phosphate glucose phosphotransferase [Prevotella sp.]|nr:undecaprenyl-phosphate glucose phosphotransferase [Prevotella sp.]